MTHLELFVEFTAVSVQHSEVEGAKISIKAMKESNNVSLHCLIEKNTDLYNYLNSKHGRTLAQANGARAPGSLTVRSLNLWPKQPE